MNIYATGMNPVDCNALKREPRVAIFQAFGEMLGCYLRNGDNVVWQRTKVGDAFPPDTDAVVVSMLLPRSLNCPYALGAMWAVHQAIMKNLPLVLYLTDWAFFKATSEYRSIAKQGQSYFSKQIGGALQYNENSDMIKKHEADLLEMCEWYGDPTSLLWKQSKVSIPKYTNWGRIDIIRQMLPGKPATIYEFDPTPTFFKIITNVPHQLLAVDPPADDRYKHWIWPSLLKDDSWVQKQALKWPIDRFGPKGFPVVRDELAVQMEYRNRVGAICPPYPTAGSGWWRSRWIHSAVAGNVLLCDVADQIAVGEAYAHFGSSYEAMSNEKLTEVANDQKQTMLDILQLDPEVMVQQALAPIEDFGV